MRISDWSSDLCSSDLASVSSGSRQSPRDVLADRPVRAPQPLREALVAPRPEVELDGQPTGYVVGGRAVGGGQLGAELHRISALAEGACQPVARERRSEERRGGKECVSTGRSRG